MAETKVRCPDCEAEVWQAAFCSACGAVMTRDPPDPYCGKVLGGWRCLDRIGRGGTSYVYKAEHVKVGCHRAMKVLRPEFLGNPRAVESMWSEARLASALRHPGLPVFHDVSALEDGTPYSVWDLVEGPSLSMRARQGLPPGDVGLMVRGLCATLEAIHAHGYAHLDVCPQNVVVTGSGSSLTPFLVDLGEARKSASTAERSADALRVGYSAPEQVLGGKVDARTDVFAVGAVLVYAATGRTFLDSRDLAAYGEDLRQLEPPKLRSLHDLPAALRMLAERCLAPDPAARPASAAAVRDSLRGGARDVTGLMPVAAGAGDLAGRELTVETPLPFGPPGEKPPPPPRSRLESVAGIKREPIELEEVLTFGRGDGNRVILDHPTVSKKHARIWVEDGMYHVEDLGSRNGTSVNGRRVVARKALKDGDAVAMGEVVFRFRVVGAD